ncbi:MAG: YybS family protein, partial [Desulfofundulus sp.]
LAEGALLAALTVVITLTGLVVPPLMFFVNFLAPLPLAVLVRRQDLKTGAAALVVAALLLFVLYGRPVTVLMMLIQLGPLGLLLGLLFKNQVRAGTAVAVAAVVASCLALLTLVLGFWMTGINPLDIGTQMHQSAAHLIEWYRQQGLIEPGKEDELRHLLQEVMHQAAILLPANLVVCSLVTTFITYYLGHLIFRRLGYVVTPLPAFKKWQFPWYLVWLVILGLAFFMGGDALGKKVFTAAGENLLYIAAFLYLILGLSVASFHFARWQLSRSVKVLLAVAVLLYWPFAVLILMTLGLLDSLLNVRDPGRHGDKGEGK